MMATRTRVSTTLELDSDAISPDCLKVAIPAMVDDLFKRANEAGRAINWNSLQFAQVQPQHRPKQTHLVMRAETL